METRPASGEIWIDWSSVRRREKRGPRQSAAWKSDPPPPTHIHTRPHIPPPSFCALSAEFNWKQLARALHGSTWLAYLSCPLRLHRKKERKKERAGDALRKNETGAAVGPEKETLVVLVFDYDSKWQWAIFTPPCRHLLPHFCPLCDFPAWLAEAA